MLRRSCGTLGTGRGLTALEPSAVLVRRVVRFARCNVLLPFFAVRLPDWQNSPPEFMVLSSMPVLARPLPRDSGRAVRGTYLSRVHPGSGGLAVLSAMVVRWFARSELQRE